MTERSLAREIQKISWILSTLVCALLTSSSALAQEHFTNCAFNTGGSATVVIEADIGPTFFNVPFVPGDEIAVFTESGLCAGVAVWVGGDTNIALTAWGDNVVTPILDGFVQGEVLSFRIWSTFFEIEGGIPPDRVNVAYDDCDNRPPPCSDTGEYVGESLIFLSELAVPVQTTGMTELPNVEPPYVLVHPNPVRNRLFFSIKNWPDRSLDLAVFDALGQTVRRSSFDSINATGSSHNSIDVADFSSGVYLLEISSRTSTMVKVFAVIN